MTVHAKVNAQIEAPGVAVQVVDYRWRRGEEIFELEKDYVLRRRAHPSKLGVSAVIGGRQQPFGHLMFFPADVSVQTLAAANDERVQGIMCRFDHAWFNSLAELPREWGPDDLARCLDLKNSRIDQAVQWMGMEAASPGFASPLLLESLSSVIAVETARYFMGDDSNLRVRTRDGKLIPSHLRRIVEYIEASSHKCPTIDEIATICDISSAHLRRAFKNTTGHTIHDYVENVRLGKARALLSETDLPLKEISYRLGFAASSTFSSVFRKAQGETPSGYRCRTRQ
ncbi:AraC family transcriptional regulator [Sphingomonadaceae bacterium G21617-S1]|nr:AraC family transcriptional regulator [Sphingomonadaceae bacterium G21617-S1]